MPEQVFELTYRCVNNGDGSVSVHFHENEAEAEAAEENEDEGWGESSVNSVKLKVENGQVFYQDYDWDAPPDQRYVWKEIPQVVG